MGMQNEKANYEELKNLANGLGQEQKRLFEEVFDKWMEVENL